MSGGGIVRPRERGRVMRERRDITGNVEDADAASGDASREVAPELKLLSHEPYQTVEEIAARLGKGNTSTRNHLTRAEEDGLVAHVLHGVHGRKGWRRYMLTGEGVQALAERAADVMDRPGATGRALATYYRRLHILVGVYQTAATVAACFDEPDLRVHLPLGGPLDGVITRPTPPYSLGVMVKQRSLDDDHFGLKVWRFRAQMAAKPSMLLVVAPSRLAQHGVTRLVQANWKGLFVITSRELLGDPDDRIWREPNRDDDVEGVWSTRQVLKGVPKHLLKDFAPPGDSYKRVAIPRRGWRPRIALTPKEWGVIYTVADWPLSKRSVIAALADATPGSLNSILRRLRAYGLICEVEARNGEKRWALTDTGIRFICWTARAADQEARKFWSSRRRADGRFVGTKLQKLNREIQHTDMVHAIVARVAEEARAVPDVEAFQILPAHLSERRPVMPDARLDLQMSSGERYVLLLEAERKSLQRKKREARLDNYAREVDTEGFKEAFPVAPYIAVALEDADSEHAFGQSQVDAGRTDLPTILTNMDELSARGGLLQAVWRRPGAGRSRERFYTCSSRGGHYE